MTQPVRVLVVGVGSIGERHVRCFQGTGRAKVSIVEPSDSRRMAVAGQYCVEQAHPSLDAALASTTHYDLAVICTPANLHIRIALQLAHWGIDLLIEKPLSTTTDGLDVLCETVEKKKLVADVAYVYRHHPALSAMRDCLQQGRFGRPVQLVATCGQHFPTYRPAYREIYYANRSTGGGAVQDALTHIMNAGQWLVGPVNQLAADAAHQVLPGVTVEDTVHVLTRQGDLLGSYSLNQHQAPNEVTITVVCENGTARFEYHRHRWRWLSRPDESWQDQTIDTLQRDALFVNQANSVLDAVARRAPVACSLPEAIHTLHINLAILAAAESKTWQSLPHAI